MLGDNYGKGFTWAKVQKGKTSSSETLPKRVHDFPATKVHTHKLPLSIPEIKIDYATVKRFSSMDYRKYIFGESNLLRTPNSVRKENVSCYYSMKMWKSWYAGKYLILSRNCHGFKTCLQCVSFLIDGSFSLLVWNWFWRKDKRKSLLNMISDLEFRDKAGKSSCQHISRPVCTLACEQTWQLRYLDKLSSSLVEICIKRKDSRNTIYVFDIETCCWNFYVNSSFDWTLSLKQFYFCALLHKLKSRLKPGILSKFKVRLISSREIILCTYKAIF